MAGTYDEDVTINKSLTLASAEGKGNTIINGQSIGYTGAVKITANNVILGGAGAGFTINGAGQAAVYFTPVSGCLVEGNDIVAASGKNALVTEGGQSNHTIMGNIFSGDPASQLVYVNGQTSVGNASTNVDFIGNTFAGIAPTGPALGQEAADSTISGNTFATVTGYASLELWGANNNVIGNEFTADLPAGGVYVWDQSSTLDIAAALTNNTFLRAVTVKHNPLLPKIWANIQDAVNEAVSGDTVNVLAGTYDEVVEVDVEGVTIRGENLDAIVDGGFWLQADYVIIDSLTVKNGFARSGSYRYAILLMGPSGELYSTKGHTITNNDLIGDGTGIKCAGIADGSDGSDDLVIYNNAIHAWRVGISLSGVSTNHMITENDIYENLKTGIELSKISNTTIEYNHIHDNTQWGIALLYDKGYGSGNISHYNNIVDNGIGVENHPDNPLFYAEANWWGHESGPNGVGPGTGDAVSTNVDYIPWTTTPY